MSLVDDLSRRRTFYTLDGLRGVAALAVVTLHYQASLRPILLPSAYLAVDLFFLMSGIVIAHSYDGRLAQGLSVRHFLLIRLVRLFPLYALGLAIATTLVLLAIATGQSNWSIVSLAPAFLFQAAMLPNLPGTGPRTELYPSNAPAWSLFWELTSNIAYAAAFPLLSRRTLAAIAVVAGVALIVGAAHYGSLDFGSRREEWVVGLVRVSFAFTVGVLIERLRATGELPFWKMPAWSLILLTILLLTASSAFGWIKDVAIVLVGFPLICIIAINVEPRNTRLFTFFGLVSYPIYVTHIPIPYERLFSGVTRRPLEAWAPWSGLVLLMAMLVVSWLLARYFDSPARNVITSALLGRSHWRSRTPS